MLSTRRPTDDPRRLRQHIVAGCAALLGATHNGGEVMASYRKKALAVAAAASMSIALAACGGSNDNNNNPSSNGEVKKGGTLTYYIRSALEHTDPQRTYV